MNKPVLGMATGAALGLLDGLSAWAYPEARTMIAAIVAGSVVKGVLTGLAAGLVARWRSTTLGLAAGIAVGAALSTVAALGQPDHYWAIVLPGMLLGAITGYVTQRYGSAVGRARVSPSGSIVAFAVLMAAGPSTAAQAPAATTDLSTLEFFLGQWQGTADGQPGKPAIAAEKRMWSSVPPAIAAPAPPPAAATFIGPMDPGVKSSRPGACPKCGMALEPDLSNPAALTRVEYTCPMHPEIVRDAPGSCQSAGWRSNREP